MFPDSSAGRAALRRVTPEITEKERDIMKKAVKKSAALALALVLLLVLLPAGASADNDGGECGAEGDNLTWTYSSNTLRIQGTGEMADYSRGGAPWDQYAVSQVEIGSGVTGIGSYAFGDNGVLTSVSMPESLSRIGDCAFLYCNNLESADIPDSVTYIGIDAFYFCQKMQNQNLPRSLTTIGDRAFGYCKKLTAISIPASVSSIGSSAFEGCSGIVSIDVDPANPYYVCVDDVLYTEDLRGLLLCAADKEGSFAVPETVVDISEGAFEGCSSLTEITIPASTKLVFDTFKGCSSLTAITVSEDNSDYADDSGVLHDKTGTTLLRCPPGKTGTYTVRSSVTSIKSGAFEDCSRLVSIDLPDGLKEISVSTFSGCSGLTSMFVPEGVSSIGSFAFDKCNNLTVVHLPASLTSIGIYAFSGCDSLRDVYFYGSREDWSAISIESNNECLQNAALHFTVPLVITVQPLDFRGAVGDKATFTVEATGDGLSYQWYVKNPGSSKFSKSSVTKATYSVTLTADNSGRQLYCVVTDQYGSSVQTNTVSMTVRAEALQITKQPVDYVGAAGSTATVTVEAAGDGLSYQWYIKNPGASKFSKSSVTKATYSVTLTASNSGRQLYCVVTDAAGNKAQTNTVSMTVEAVPFGAPVLKSATAGTNGITVSWNAVSGATQYRVYRQTGSGGWTGLGDVTGTSYTDAAVTSGTAYTYTVKAYNGSTWSGFDAKGITATAK